MFRRVGLYRVHELGGPGGLCKKVKSPSKPFDNPRASKYGSLGIPLEDHIGTTVWNTHTWFNYLGLGWGCSHRCLKVN